MAKSSIHIASGKAGYLSHNDRSLKTNNSIFNDEPNEYTNNNKEAFSIYRKELSDRTKAYLDNHTSRKKLHSKTITHLSAIVNLNQHHTLEDMQQLIEYLETSLDTKVFQVAIHRDEGHIKDGKDIKNYHAHIEFMGIDSKGSSIRRKLTKQYLKNLQTETANILGMERGVKNSKAKRLDTYEFKKHKEKEEQTLKPILATQKDLKKEIANLRAELKENKAVRSDYAQLEQINRELKEQLKSKELTELELKAEMQQLKEKLLNPIKIEVIKEVENPINRELEKRVEELEKLVYHPTITRSADGSAVPNAEVAEKYIELLNDEIEKNSIILELKENKLERRFKEIRELKDKNDEAVNALKAISKAFGIEPRSFEQVIDEVISKKAELSVVKEVENPINRVLEEENKKLKKRNDEAVKTIVGISKAFGIEPQSFGQVLDEVILKKAELTSTKTTNYSPPAPSPRR